MNDVTRILNAAAQSDARAAYVPVVTACDFDCVRKSESKIHALRTLARNLTATARRARSVWSASGLPALLLCWSCAEKREQDPRTPNAGAP